MCYVLKFFACVFWVFVCVCVCACEFMRVREQGVFVGVVCVPCVFLFGYVL